MFEILKRFATLQRDLEEKSEDPNCPESKVEKKCLKFKDDVNEAAENKQGFFKQKTK